MTNIEESRQIHEKVYNKAVGTLYYLIGSENQRRFLANIHETFEIAKVRNKVLESLEKNFFPGQKLCATTSDRRIELNSLRDTIGGIQ